MSFLVGPLSGALIAGGVYYGFSNLIQTRTEQHRADLHRLSKHMLEAPSLIPAPPSASSRIPVSSSLLQTKWNAQIESLFHGVRNVDERVIDWGRRVLYGGGGEEERLHAATNTTTTVKST